MSGRKAFRRRIAVARGSFLSDLVSTSAAQVLSILLNACSLAVISRRLGEFDLGLYTLERRSMALLQPLILLGLSVATPRYIALSLGRQSRDERVYATVGAGLVLAFSGLLGVFTLIFPAPVASVAFGDSDSVGLARALGGFAFATAVYQMTYSVSRGYLHMGRANLLELTVVGLLPLLLGAIGPTDIVSLMWTLNVGILAATALVAATEVDLRRTHPAIGEGWREVRAKAGELLRFGLARTPGDIAIVALFAAAPVAVVHWAGPTEAGYTSIVLSSVNLVSVAAVPLGIILLPRVALEAGHPEGIAFEKYVLLGEATLDVALAFSGLLLLASPVVVDFWVPEAPHSVVTATQIAALGLPGYVFYLVFRSYLDAVDRRPLSSAATIAGLSCLALVLPAALILDLWPAPVAASVGVSASLLVAGAVTFLLVQRRIPGFVPLSSLAPVALLMLGMVALGLALSKAGLLLIAFVTAISAITCSVVFVIARRSWIIELRNRMGTGMRA